MVELNGVQRNHLQLGLGDWVELKEFEMVEPKKYVASATFTVEALSNTGGKVVMLEHSLLQELFQKQFQEFILCEGNKFVVKVEAKAISLTFALDKLLTASLDQLMKESEEGKDSPFQSEKKNSENMDNTSTFQVERGILSQHSLLLFQSSKEGPLKITNPPSSSSSGFASNSIILPDWNFEKMGIGGLDNEFSTIFRRAFASRLFPPSEIAKYGIKHVRGLLLFGPPGTGSSSPISSYFPLFPLISLFSPIFLLFPIFPYFPLFPYFPISPYFIFSLFSSHFLPSFISSFFSILCCFTCNK